MREAILRTLREQEQRRRDEIAAYSGPSAPGFNRDELMLAVGPETGQFLNTLIRAKQARSVLEIGGSYGYSTLWQGEAVEANGGRLISIEALPVKADASRELVARAGLDKTVQIITGDALAVLSDLPGPFDFVLIDAWKDDYPTYLDLVFPKLAIGGLIAADNITRPRPGPGIVEYVRRARTRPDSQSQLIAIGSGVELTVKLPPGSGPRPSLGDPDVA
jgi:predicted O-methyltransferase YrrM